jgi:dihydrofolate synthase/folylpolyglutamate synthase
VVSYLERIQINGKFISEDSFSRLTEMVKEAIARIESAGHTPPTVFEIETAIAFLYFKKENCDFVVLECGLGGELDATNIIPPPICAVFSSISLDHLGILGNSLKEIAQTKSGIIKTGCSVISGPQKTDVLKILESKAAQNNCPFYAVDKENLLILSENYEGQTINYKHFKSLSGPLAGKHQADNIATALEVIISLQKMGYKISNEAIVKGLANTHWPGRFTLLGREPLFFIDGAHNEDAAQRLKESIDTYFPEQKWIYIMGVFKDKEYEKIAELMASSAKVIHTVSLPNSERTLSASALANILKKYCDAKTDVFSEGSIQDAVECAFNEALQMKLPVLAFGSLSYLGEIIEQHQLLTNKKSEDKL